MRVGILSLKAGTAAGGLATYEQCLINAIAAQDHETEYHVFCVSPVVPDAFDTGDAKVVFHVLRPRQRYVNMTASAPLAIRRARLDLLHATILPPFSPGVPYVFTAHGPEMFIDPTFFPLRIRLQLLPLIRRAYRRSAYIMSVSGDTLDYIVRNVPGADRRSRVVYNGCLPVFSPRDADVSRAEVAARHGITDRYVLFVGRIEPRKNPMRMLEAYARFRDRTGGAIKLVIAGGATWSAAEAEDAIARLAIGPDVIRLGHVEHDQLPDLYAGAEMFVFPSLWEGFGLPLIEAMRCGTPTITSDVSCLPEVSGGASLLIDPRDPDSIADAMVRIVEEPGLATSLRERGLQRGAEFSWERCARETIDVYRTVYEQLSGNTR